MLPASRNCTEGASNAGGTTQLLSREGVLYGLRPTDGDEEYQAHRSFQPRLGWYDIRFTRLVFQLSSDFNASFRPVGGAAPLLRLKSEI